jgi:hypothetical protein
MPPLCAGTVLDHHRLSKALLQALADDARHRVGKAARGIRHDQLHLARRLRLRGHGQNGDECRRGDGAQQVDHGAPLPVGNTKRPSTSARVRGMQTHASAHRVAFRIKHTAAFPGWRDIV